MKKWMLNLGAIFLMAALVWVAAIPAILGRTAGTPVNLIEDIDRLKSRFIHQEQENVKYRAAFFVVGLLSGAGLAFLGTGICLKMTDREREQFGGANSGSAGAPPE